MIIEFIFSTSNYLQKKKKTSNYDNLSNDYQKYIYIYTPKRCSLLHKRTYAFMQTLLRSRS